MNYNSGDRSTTFLSGAELTIQLTSTDLATPGSYPVYVTNPAPLGGTSNTLNFVVGTSIGYAHTWGGSLSDGGTSVAVDSSGNIYAAGSTNSFGAGGSDVLIVKYNSSGSFLWAKTWGGSSNESASAIKVGPDGFLYVVGGTLSFGAGSYDLFLLKLDTDGNLVWGKTWGGFSYDQGYDLAFDASGNIYAVGESYTNGKCVILLKFDQRGNFLQAVSYKGESRLRFGLYGCCRC